MKYKGISAKEMTDWFRTETKPTRPERKLAGRSPLVFKRLFDPVEIGFLYLEDAKAERRAP